MIGNQGALYAQSDDSMRRVSSPEFSCEGSSSVSGGYRRIKSLEESMLNSPSSNHMGEYQIASPGPIIECYYAELYVPLRKAFRSLHARMCHTHWQDCVHPHTPAMALYKKVSAVGDVNDEEAHGRYAQELQKAQLALRTNLAYLIGDTDIKVDKAHTVIDYALELSNKAADVYLGLIGYALQDENPLIDEEMKAALEGCRWLEESFSKNNIAFNTKGPWDRFKCAFHLLKREQEAALLKKEKADARQGMRSALSYAARANECSIM